MSSVTPAELTTLRADPAALEREINHYLRIRDEAESKLRAVVDEVTAREYLVRAEDLQHQAALVLERANAEASKVRDEAASAALQAQEASKQLAGEVRAAAERDGRELVAQAARLRDEAERMRADAQARAEELELLKTAASSALAQSTSAAKRHEAAANELERVRAELSQHAQRFAEVLR